MDTKVSKGLCHLFEMLTVFRRGTYFFRVYRIFGSAPFYYHDFIHQVHDINTAEKYCIKPRNPFHTTAPILSNKLTELDFERICDETLESLCEFFEVLIDEHSDLKGADVTYHDGVLTVSLGAKGTYVINRQTPNKQIWLSSPKSGPKRYDLINKKVWIYKHDQKSLHALLQEELSELLKTEVNLATCIYSSL